MGLNIIKQAPNQFYLDVRVRRPDAPGEDQIREIFHGPKEAAENRYVELRKQIKERQALRCRFETFSDLMRWYADERPPAPKDINIIDNLTRILGNVSIPAFPDRFAAYRKHMQRNPAPTTGRPWSNATVNRYTAIVRAAFQLAVDQDPPLMEKNPITKAKFPHLEETPRDTVLSPEEERNLFNVIRKHAPHLLALIQFALQVPCRKSELVRMRREDLDLFTGKYGAIRVKNGTTKNKKGLWKPIPPDMADYFRHLPSDCPWLFYGVKNGKYRPLGDFKKAWATCKRLAGISDFHFHDTRHMSASEMVKRGTPIPIVNDIAGWDTDMLRDYFHLDTAESVTHARFSSDGMRTLAAYTPEGEDRKEAVG